MAFLGIDHVVVATPDLDGAVGLLRAQLGIEAGGGGTHPTTGTANRIAWFGDTYLELIDVTDRDRAADTWLGGPTLRLLDERGGGFVAYALATDDLQADLVALRAVGSTLVGPAPGERRRQDGRMVRWTVAAPTLVGPTAPPFLIEHDRAAAEWTAAERWERKQQVHPIGGPVRLANLEISMVDPARVAASYRQTIGIRAEPWLDAGDWALSAVIGGQRIALRRADGSPGPSVVIHLTAQGDRSATADLFGCQFVVEGISPD